MQKCTRLQFAKWAVKERYFGVFESITTVCTCASLDDAANIIDCLVKSNEGRTKEFYAQKIDDENWDIMDEEIIMNPITGETKDLRPYKAGISCLGRR